MKNIASFGNKVVPTTWMTAGGKVLPMEFAVAPVTYGFISLTISITPFSLRLTYLLLIRDNTPTPPPAFVDELLSVLTSNGCDGLFGIDTVAKKDWSEMKIGDASVVVSSHDGDDYDQDKFISVAFVFDEKKPKFRVHGRCTSNHRHTSRPPKPPSA